MRAGRSAVGYRTGVLYPAPRRPVNRSGPRWINTFSRGSISGRDRLDQQMSSRVGGRLG